jgi:hypothetical protein
VTLFTLLGWSLEPATWDRAHRQGVHVTDLPVLEPEQVAVRQLVVAEARQDNDSANIGIDDETSAR